MHIRCPHCKIALEILDDNPIEELSCPSCGVSLQDSLAGDDTLTHDRQVIRQIAHFQLLEFLGRGAFGEVWKARDTKLERIVALKIPRNGQFDEETFARFLREARAAAQIHHPNIVAVYEVGREGSTIYIASEFIDGISLKERLKIGRYGPQQAAELCGTLAAALDRAHQAGVVHRDLKPANVLIDGQGQPHVTDFGLAKREGVEITVTADGEILGTAAYMPPEQARGESHLADAQSDVYSLGVMLYEFIAGTLPFKGDVRSVLYQIQNVEPQSPSKLDRTVPRDIETICLKAMEKEPARRFATASAMAVELRRFVRGEPIESRPVGPLERVWRWSRRRPALAASGSIAAVAVCALIALLSWIWVETRPLRRAVQLETDPPGAMVVFHPLDPLTGEPQPERAVRPVRVSPVEVDLEPGQYLVVAVLNRDGHSFHEVYRTVPAPDAALPQVYDHLNWDGNPDGGVTLPKITIPLDTVTQDMAFFQSTDQFTIGKAELEDVPPHTRNVPAFWLDPTEVTVAAYRARKSNPPGFASLNSPPAAENAMSLLSYDEALSYAEQIGKRLPTEWEYEIAATNRGQTEFPWGNDSSRIVAWPHAAVGTPDWDRLASNRVVQGLYSNVAEWTCSWPLPYPKNSKIIAVSPSASENRIVRGGTASTIAGTPSPDDWSRGPRSRVDQPRRTWPPGLGFRCARSAAPRLSPDDFSRWKADE